MQQLLVAVSFALFALKVGAYWLTGSVAILTDALESTVNLIAGLVGLYSLNLAAKPRDENHPYGHGKVEFLSAAIEGTLVMVAGVVIIYEATVNLLHPHALGRLDMGMLLIGATAVINYIVGTLCVRVGKRNHSLALVASGAHLKSDTYTTAGLLIGLSLLYLTGAKWLDSAVAIVFAFIIIRTGYLILRQSISGIMDESDRELISQLTAILEKERRPSWVDLHHMRVVNYAGFFHIDCHLTVPRYISVEAAHHEMDAIGAIMTEQFSADIEFSIHLDPCVASQCSLCQQAPCPVRAAPFVKTQPWTAENVQQTAKHRLVVI